MEAKFYMKDPYQTLGPQGTSRYIYAIISYDRVPGNVQVYAECQVEADAMMERDGYRLIPT